MNGRGNKPYFYLRQDEAVLVRLEPEKEWALSTFLGVALALTTLQAIVFFALRQWPVAPAWTLQATLGGYLALLVAMALVAWRRWATTEYALTDQRIYARHGRLRTRVHFTTHDRITDIRYHQGALERLLGISRVTFMTAGGDVSLLGLRDAIAFKEQAENAREAFIQRLLEKAGLDEAARESRAPKPAARQLPVDEEGVEVWPTDETPEGAPVQAPPPPPWSGPRPTYLKTGDVPVWFGKPIPIAAVSALVPFAGLLAFVLISGAAGGATLFSLPFLLVLAAGAGGLRLMQLRRMEYTVTDKRVYTRAGIIGTTVTQLTYDKITDITYRQDLLGRIFGFGGLTVNTAGSNQAPVSMMGLKDPLEVKSLIERARARYLREEGEE